MRTVNVEFSYAFDEDDLKRIARAMSFESNDDPELSDEEISAYVSEILTFELTSPDPLEND